ncbi:DUF6470 family protein [Bacillus sp. FJAT-45350]|uniref:DUF6470 family protein n=1 Tax=Bacillus sp. FJAT-45350 TaxID=2011014 RepID=UPI000BB8EDFB|nr:DUF6470 family protein [Bacillus sp. FJAT-45350]
MQAPYLQINSTHAHIGMKKQEPHVQIQQRNADLQIRQNHIDNIQISRRASQLHIDQNEAFADADVKGPLRRADEFFQKSKQSLMQYLAKASQQGDQLMKIENGGGDIPRIASANSELIRHEFGMGWTPKSADKVKINFQPSELSFNVSLSMPSINVSVNPPSINMEKWQTDVYIRQKNSINIQAVGLNVNRGL